MTSALVRVSLLGTLPGGEQWSVNPVYRINSPEVVSFSQVNTMVLQINALTIPTGIRLMQSTSTMNLGARVEARTAAGALEAQSEANRAAPVAGTGTGALPFQSSIVASLRTPGPGASARGRVYWPATGALLTAGSLRLGAGDLTTILSASRSYLKSIQDIIDNNVASDVILAVWSRKLATTFGVTRIMVGDVIDTQRRRRDSVAETYNELTYPV